RRDRAEPIAGDSRRSDGIGVRHGREFATGAQRTGGRDSLTARTGHGKVETLSRKLAFALSYPHLGRSPRRAKLVKRQSPKGRRNASEPVATAPPHPSPSYQPKSGSCRNLTSRTTDHRFLWS